MYTKNPLTEISHQEELIIKYFCDIEEKIRDANSLEQADIICKNIIDAFKQECISEILIDTIESYLDCMIKKYWKDQ